MDGHRRAPPLARSEGTVPGNCQAPRIFGMAAELTSPPGAEVVRFEALPGSSPPAKLAELGWQVQHLGINTRILRGAVTETYIDHDSPGRPQVTRCHAGPVEVAVYETPMPKA